jgi:hypothetical protein
LNTPLVNGGFSLIHLKVILKAMFLHNGNKFLYIPWAHALHMKKCTKTFGFYCEKYAVKNTCGIYVLTCNYSKADTLNSAAFNVNVLAE